MVTRKTKQMLLICFLVVSFTINLTNGDTTDTNNNNNNIITANQSLSGNQTLVSSGGVFRLGFFKPGNNNPHYYIGMWYNQISKLTPVWVANRESPITDIFDSQLKILDGNLVLFNGSSSKFPVWSTNLNPNSSRSVQAVLQDNGNLVLLDLLSSNSSNLTSTQPLWQSFDYPTDTWLPGSKIALNHRTKRNQRLISWKNDEDPAPGLFSLQLDPNGTSQYINMWNSTKLYWTSGTWNGKIFSLVPEMRLNYIYNFSYVSNEDENYFTYSMYNTSILSRFVMDVTGRIRQLTWLELGAQWNSFWAQPRQQCEVHAFCGAFGSCNQLSITPCKCFRGFEPKEKRDWDLSDHSSGCVRSTSLQCEGSNSTTSTANEADKFLPTPYMKMPDNGQSVEAANVIACETACLSNCSCSIYTFVSNTCLTWNDAVLNLQQLGDGDSSGQTLYIKLAASEFPKSNNNSVTIIAAIVGSLVGVLFLLGIVLFYVMRKRRLARATRVVEGSLISFWYKDLQNATKNFSEKLGGGGFGSVFKGVLPDSTVIAVKKLEGINQGEKQFRSEVSTIGTIQHVNLVRLRGFCSEGAKKLLVYDCMPNGSLNVHIFPENDTAVMDWKTRYQIALGTARGLVYLHEKCRDCIIHCDIKPENILLDANFVPKVADFGLAKLVGREFSRVLTTMRGTRGYLAPEWISGVAITAKADVYSYGMMLFEIVSGRRNSEQSEDRKVKFFPTFAAIKVIKEDGIIELLDHRLAREGDEEKEVTLVCRVACWCIQDDETHRPSMSQVVQMLEGVLDVNLPPLPRSLQVFADNEEHIVFFTESSSSNTEKNSASSASSSLMKSFTSSTSSKS